MKMWIEKDNCTGCGACTNACKFGAIKMVEDKYGFKHPEIDNSKCVNCGMCKRTCPILNAKDNNHYKKPVVYAAWSKNNDTRYNSTSGGIFTEIAHQIIREKGYVAGAKYNDKNLVVHALVENEKGIEQLRQSKYVQSDTGNIYKKVREKLEKKSLVAFVGAPCQVAGLYKFLIKDYPNLLTIEFICRGMNSPKAYKKWLEELEIKNKSKIKKVWFKYKINGWKASPKCTKIEFRNGKNIVLNGKKNTYMCGYLGPNLYIRPSCGNCKFKGIPRQADITLADFWGIEASMDNDQGTSMILVNSERGEEYIKKIKPYIVFKEKRIEDILEGNECFTKSVEINEKSKEFLSRVNEYNFDKLVKKYEPKDKIIKRIVRKAKRLIRK